MTIAKISKKGSKMKSPSSVALMTPLIMIMLSGCTGCTFLDLYKLPDGNTIEQEVIEEVEKIVEDEYEKNVKPTEIKSPRQ